jgi:hypothetical protein
MATASPPRRRAPAKKTPQPVIQSTATGDFEPLQFTTPDTPAEVERVVIAYLDEYPLTMPATVPPNVGLKIIRTSRRSGDEAAMMQMLEEVLGAEGYERLENWSALTVDNLIDLFKVVQKVALGALEVPKSSSRNG